MVATRTIIGIVGNFISCGLFLSQIPTFWKIIKRKDVEDFSPNPALATILNCAMWVFYGLPFVHPNSTLVWTINGIGLVIEAAYIIIYLIYANQKSKRNWVYMVLLGELVAVAAIVAGVLLGAHGTTRRTLVVGIICILLNICMYAMPLDNALTVLRTKSVEYMTLSLLVANLCNGSIWTAYGFLPFDVNLVVCNGIGALLGAAQVILYFYISCSYPQGKKAGNEVEMATADAKIRPDV
ncbi:hypothetical protein ACHQM5_007118 [Ranunculus cassubicifolius]